MRQLQEAADHNISSCSAQVPAHEAEELAVLLPSLPLLQMRLGRCQHSRSCANRD
jgi:hypothetical protein